MIGLLFCVISLFSIFFSECGGASCCGGSSRQMTLPWILLTQNEGQHLDCIGAVIGHEDGNVRVLIPNECTNGIGQKAAQFLNLDGLGVPLPERQAVVPMDELLATVTYEMPDNIRNQPTLLPDQESENKGKWRDNGSTFHYSYQTGKWERVVGSVITDAECNSIAMIELADNQYFCVLVPNSDFHYLRGTPYFKPGRNSNTLWGLDAGRSSMVYLNKGMVRIFYRVQYFVDTYGLSASQTPEPHTTK